jgi:hypothetical protein
MIQEIARASILRQAALIGLFVLGGLLLSAGGLAALIAMSLFTDPTPPTPLSDAIGKLTFACFPLLVLAGALLWVLVAVCWSGRKSPGPG